MHPTQKGQKYLFQNSTYTVRSFHGSSGIEFDSHTKAKAANPKDKFIAIVSEEYPTGGMIDKDCTLLK